MFEPRKAMKVMSVEAVMDGEPVRQCCCGGKTRRFSDRWARALASDSVRASFFAVGRLPHSLVLSVPIRCLLIGETWIERARNGVERISQVKCPDVLCVARSRPFLLLHLTV